jgi:hypothetical protein
MASVAAQFGDTDVEIVDARIIEAKFLGDQIVDGRIVGGRVVDVEELSSRGAHARSVDRDNLHREIVAGLLLGLAILFILLL